MAKHPRTGHGLKDATASLSAVAEWWARWPDANVGLPTGTHFTVLDVDVKSGGDDALRALEAEHGPLPTTWRVLTGGGGFHIFFQPVTALRNSASLLGPGLDVRGEGGYVVAAGSTHASGREYAWEIGADPDAAPLAPMPGWMAERLARPRGSGEAAEDEEWIRRLSGVPLGQQNTTATQIAGRLARAGFSSGEIAEILLGYGARCTPPISREDAATFRDIARRIWEKEQAKRAAADPVAPPIRLGWPYKLDDGRIVTEKILDAQGIPKVVTTALANFDAWIEQDQVIDDGSGEPAHVYRLAGLVGPKADYPGPLPTVEVPATQFERLEWVGAAWGARAVIYAVPGGQRHHLARAIQTRAKPEIRTIYAHTGWRRIDGVWRFLTGSGAVGDPSIRVQLRGGFERFGLPGEPDPARAAAGMRHLVGAFRAAGPAYVMTPLFGAIFRAPLCQWLPTPFALYLLGHTGTGKSTLAALTLSAFGDFPNKTTLAVDWSSTANSLEDLLFTFKDHLFVADDIGRSTETYESQAKLERILRAQGNLSGRRRMRRDGTLQPLRAPRGLLLVTAEIPVLDEGLLARVYQVELRAGDILLSGRRLKPIDAAQDAKGLAAMRHAMAAYAGWLRADDEEVLAARIAQGYRAALESLPETTEAAHGRIPENVANLLVGVRFGLDYAVSVDALTRDAADRQYEEAGRTLLTVAIAQRRTMAGRRATHQFLATLQGLLHARRVCLLPRHTRPEEHKPPPTMVGWYDDETVFLMPKSMGEVYRAARDVGEPLAIPEDRIMAELHEATILRAAEDEALARPTKLAGKTRRVFVLAREALDRFLGVAFDVAGVDAGGTEPGDEHGSPF